MPKYTFKSTDKATLTEYDQKSALYQTMHENKSFNKNPANHALYHALLEALIDDSNAIDKGVADTSASEKEPVEEPIAEVVMDDAVNTAGEEVDPLTFNDLMVTPIDFSNIELEYNFQECFNALTDKLDWNNPEGDHYPLDLSKPLPLQGCPGHLTIAVDYFFYNDLKYLKTYDPEKTYTTSITKTKEARYDIVGIENMVLMLWSTIKHVYDKDAEKGIKQWGERRDFLDLHLNDIKDMLLFAVQHKLFHLNNSDIVNCIVALRMFTRSLIIKRRVEDLQLGVESYQKKLNITIP
ncbi:hypothetical protein Tco_1181728, partial [Tanacetum coccineum]